MSEQNANNISQLQSDYESLQKNYELLAAKYFRQEEQLVAMQKQNAENSTRIISSQSKLKKVEQQHEDCLGELEYFRIKNNALTVDVEKLIEEKRNIKKEQEVVKQENLKLKEEIKKLLRQNDILLERVDWSQSYKSIQEQLQRVEENSMNVLSAFKYCTQGMIDEFSLMKLEFMRCSSNRSVSLYEIQKEINCMKLSFFEKKMDALNSLFPIDNSLLSMEDIVVSSIDQTIKKHFSGEAITVAFAISNAYAPFCGIAIESMLKNSNVGYNYEILLLYQDDISFENKQKIASISSKYPNVIIRFINIKEIGTVYEFYTYGHFTKDVYSRVFLASPVFSEYDKILFLDSDMLILGDVSNLWEKTDLGEMHLAAAEDMFVKYLLYKDRKILYNKELITFQQYISGVLALDNPDKYFNTGVLLMNLKQIRLDQMFEIWIQQLQENQYMYFEQDMFNAMYSNNYVKLDCGWNNQLLESNYDDASQLMREVTTDSYILHFCGNNKLWLISGQNYHEEYLKYIEVSPWQRQFKLIMNTSYLIESEDES